MKRRGHWTKGRRRNGLTDDQAKRLRIAVARIARRRQLAAVCRRVGIARKTPYRWLHDIGSPPLEMVKVILKEDKDVRPIGQANN